MYWNPKTACILPWNNHSLIEDYNSPTQPIRSIPVSSSLGMEYHPQYRTHIYHLKGIQEGRNHQEILHVRHLITLLQGENNLHNLAQTYTSLCYHQP